jgi:hypothetical protein
MIGTPTLNEAAVADNEALLPDQKVYGLGGCAAGPALDYPAINVETVPG